MQTEVIVSGFGGQGTLFAGQLISYAAMECGKNTTWIPSYGPEMRGGTANCTVVVSDDEIGSPLARNPEAVIAMNLPSMDKYEPLVKPGGILVVNQSMVDRKVKRTDIQVVYIEANKIAEDLGNKRLANMVMVGGLLANHPFLKMEDMEKALKEHLPAKHAKLLEVNFQALKKGAAHKAV